MWPKLWPKPEPESGRSGPGTPVAVSDRKISGTSHLDPVRPIEGQAHPIPPVLPLEPKQRLLKRVSTDVPYNQIPFAAVIISTESDTGGCLKNPPFTHRMFTDTSTKGWGANLDDITCQGVWTHEESQLNVNCFKMRAFRPSPLSDCILQHFNVLVAMDITTVVAYISKLGWTRSWSLWKETKSLFTAVVQLIISIHARFIHGKINVLADDLSRSGQILPTEWSFHQDICQSCLQQMGSSQSRPICDHIQYKVPAFCIPNTIQQGLRDELGGKDLPAVIWQDPPRPSFTHCVLYLALCEVN